MVTLFLELPSNFVGFCSQNLFNVQIYMSVIYAIFHFILFIGCQFFITIGEWSCNLLTISVKDIVLHHAQMHILYKTRKCCF